MECKLEKEKSLIYSTLFFILLEIKVKSHYIWLWYELLQRLWTKIEVIRINIQIMLEFCLWFVKLSIKAAIL